MGTRACGGGWPHGLLFLFKVLKIKKIVGFSPTSEIDGGERNI
jgi:hypothetical protein